MTTKQEKLNAVFFSALMVLSVMVGSIALVGSAAATDGSAHFGASSYSDGDTITLSVTDSAANHDTATAQSVDVTVSSEGDQETITLGETGSDTSTFEGTVNVEQAADSNGDGVIQAQSGDTISADYQNSTVTNTAEFDADTAAPSVKSAVEYDGDIEIAFNEDLDSATLNNVYVDGATVDDYSSATVNGTSGQVELTSATDITPNQELIVNLDAADTNLQSDTYNVTVDVTASTIQEGVTGTQTVYKGAKVAYVANEKKDGILIEKSNGNYEFQGDTGLNSQIYVFNTEGKNLDVDYYFNDTSTGDSVSDTLTLRSLDLSATAQSTTVTNEQHFDVDISANAGNRPVTARVLDADGNVVNETNLQLDGSGDVTATLIEGTVGNYTVEVLEDNTGVSSTTNTIVVEEQGESQANFPSELNAVNERGDIVEIPVNLANTNSGFVKIGSEDANYVVYGEVTDNDGDNTVTLQVNTYNTKGTPYGVSVKGDSSDNFEVVDEENSTGVARPLDTGSYDLEAGATGVGDQANSISTFTVAERSTDSATTWVTGSGTDFSGVEDLDKLAQRKDAANGDKVVLAVEATGVFGNLANNGFTETDDLSLTIEETQAQQNRDKRLIPVNGDNVKTITDAENNTLYLVIDTNKVQPKYPDGETSKLEAGQTWNATFQINGDGNLADSNESVSTVFNIVEKSVTLNKNDDDVVEVTGSEQATVSGTSTLAPGTDISVQVRSDVEGNRFIYTNSATVDSEGNWETTFDLAGIEKGTEFTVRVRKPVNVERTGKVVDSVSTTTEPGTTETVTSTTPDTTTSQSTTEPPQTSESTDTPEDPGTESDGGVPGFGLSAALIALIGAALIALRRD